MTNLINGSIPKKLVRWRELRKIQRMDLLTFAQEAELHTLSSELVDLMETELICEGLLEPVD